MRTSKEIEGPWRFLVVRQEDETGVSGTGHVADGCLFADGTAVIRWRTEYRSTAVYASFEDLNAIHGHGGKTSSVFLDEPPTPAFHRGMNDFVQDDYEGCAFSSIGGPGAVRSMRPPPYVSDGDAREYLRGYRAAARLALGDDFDAPEIGRED